MGWDSWLLASLIPEGFSIIDGRHRGANSRIRSRPPKS